MAYSEDACRSAGEKLGLEFGGGDFEFIGNYVPKGCYAYTEEDSKYGASVYYGTGGNTDDMKKDPISRNKYRPLGYDCSSNSHLVQYLNFIIFHKIFNSNPNNIIIMASNILF